MTGRFTPEALETVQAEASSLAVDLQLTIGALSALRDRGSDGKDLGDDNPLKDVVARLHAARHTMQALVALARSHPAELAEYRNMSAEREAPPAGGFELRGFAPRPAGNWERLAHPGDPVGDVVEPIVIQTADDAAAVYGDRSPMHEWARSMLDDDEATVDELDDGGEAEPRAAGPVEIELARRIGYYRRSRGHDYLWIEPLRDGRAVSLLPWGAGGVQLSIGRLGSGFHDDTWVYTAELAGAAWRAALTWDGTGEPDGWYRHPASGRRREGGDPTKETTR